MLKYFSLLVQSNQKYIQTPNLIHIYNKRIIRKAFNILRLKDY
jgi:hypothetical protein